MDEAANEEGELVDPFDLICYQTDTGYNCNQRPLWNGITHVLCPSCELFHALIAEGQPEEAVRAERFEQFRLLNRSGGELGENRERLRDMLKDRLYQFLEPTMLQVSGPPASSDGLFVNPSIEDIWKLRNLMDDMKPKRKAQAAGWFGEEPVAEDDRGAVCPICTETLWSYDEAAPGDIMFVKTAVACHASKRETGGEHFAHIECMRFYCRESKVNRCPLCNGHFFNPSEFPDDGFMRDMRDLERLREEWAENKALPVPETVRVIFETAKPKGDRWYRKVAADRLWTADLAERAALFDTVVKGFRDELAGLNEQERRERGRVLFSTGPMRRIQHQRVVANQQMAHMPIGVPEIQPPEHHFPFNPDQFADEPEDPDLWRLMRVYDEPENPADDEQQPHVELFEPADVPVVNDELGDRPEIPIVVDEDNAIAPVLGFPALHGYPLPMETRIPMSTLREPMPDPQDVDVKFLRLRVFRDLERFVRYVFRHHGNAGEFVDDYLRKLYDVITDGMARGSALRAEIDRLLSDAHTAIGGLASYWEPIVFHEHPNDRSRRGHFTSERSIMEMARYENVVDVLERLMENDRPTLRFPRDTGVRTHYGNALCPVNLEDEGIVDFVLPRNTGAVLQPMETRCPVAHDAAEFFRYINRDRPGSTQEQIDNSADFIEKVIDDLVSADPTIAGPGSELENMLGYIRNYWTIPNNEDSVRYRFRDPAVGPGGDPRDEDDLTVQWPINECLGGQPFDRLLNFIRFIVQVRGLQFPEPPLAVRPNRRDEWLPPRRVTHERFPGELV